MKTEFVDVNETRKNLVVEIDSTTVDAEIDKIARDYGKAARIPGFRPGKVPAKVVRQRFRDQILHDVAHGLIPRAVDEALRERGVEPVDTPDIKDVVVEEGQPLKFTATFDTVPPIDPGDYVDDSAPPRRRDGGRGGGGPGARGPARARRALRAGRGARRRDGRLGADGPGAHDARRNRGIVLTDADAPLDGARDGPKSDNHQNVTVDIGATANPPGFDDGAGRADRGGAEDVRRARIRPTTRSRSWPGRRSNYDVTIKAIRKRIVPELDDEFAKDLGDFASLDALQGAGARGPGARGEARSRIGSCAPS